MGVIESAVERMGREVAQILFVELAQGADQRARFVHDFGGEGIGLVFVTPRPPVRQRQNQNVTTPENRPNNSNAGTMLPG